MRAGRFGYDLVRNQENSFSREVAQFNIGEVEFQLSTSVSRAQTCNCFSIDLHYSFSVGCGPHNSSITMRLP